MLEERLAEPSNSDMMIGRGGEDHGERGVVGSKE